MRWAARGRGKRGGARVIYYNLLQNGTIWLLMAYTKAKLDNLPASMLKELKKCDLARKHLIGKCKRFIAISCAASSR